MLPESLPDTTAWEMALFVTPMISASSVELQDFLIGSLNCSCSSHVKIAELNVSLTQGIGNIGKEELSLGHEFSIQQKGAVDRQPLRLLRWKDPKAFSCTLVSSVLACARMECTISSVFYRKIRVPDVLY